jgi:hypothetical protein
MKVQKKKWIIVCPNCDSEEETRDEYTEDELDKKGLLIDTQKKRVIKHCFSCLQNVN